MWQMWEESSPTHDYSSIRVEISMTSSHLFFLPSFWNFFIQHKHKVFLDFIHRYCTIYMNVITIKDKRSNNFSRLQIDWRNLCTCSNVNRMIVLSAGGWLSEQLHLIKFVRSLISLGIRAANSRINSRLIIRMIFHSLNLKLSNFI